MFYDNLKAVCEAKNLKITTVVKECGGALGSISKWKNGANPNSDIVIKLSLHLGVTTDYLLLGAEPYEIPNTNISLRTQNLNMENLSETACELVRIFDNLPIKEKIRLMNIIYDYEEEYLKNNT